MNTVRMSNISLSDYRKFLFEMGCVRVANGTKGRGGHELWVKKGFSRPITLQSHIDPVPERVLRNGLATLGMTRKDFVDWYLSK